MHHASLLLRVCKIVPTLLREVNLKAPDVLKTQVSSLTEHAGGVKWPLTFGISNPTDSGHISNHFNIRSCAFFWLCLFSCSALAVVVAKPSLQSIQYIADGLDDEAHRSCQPLSFLRPGELRPRVLPMLVRSASSSGNQ